MAFHPGAIRPHPDLPVICRQAIHCGIRERLRQNTRDVSAKVREEALYALANRGDAQAEALLSQLP